MGAEREYRHGDLVRIADDLGPHKIHFEKGCEAIIDYSYAERYGGDDRDSYAVIFPETGNRVSWYQGGELTFIRHVGQAAIDRIMAERIIRETSETSLPWIVTNWNSIRDQVPGATMIELMKRIGIDNPWGNQGEGMEFFKNMKITHLILDPVLKSGDLQRVEAFLTDMRKGLWRK